jgi:hypothetical protein
MLQMNYGALEYMFGTSGGLTLDEEYEVIYTELLKRGISIKLENKLVLGIGEQEQKESA